MKHILFLAIVLSLSIGMVNAQSYSTLYKTFTDNGDTVTNTGTVNLLASAINYYDSGSFQVVNTKISGTVAGKTYFQASNDGTNFVKLDSLTNTNQTTNTKIFTDVPPRYRFYQLSSTGSGTMAMKTSGFAMLKIRPSNP